MHSPNRRCPWFAVIVGTAVMLAVSPGALAQPAAATDPEPTWADTPELITAAISPVTAGHRACIKGSLPRTLALTVFRAPNGATAVAMPMPPVGRRGLTDEERCLARVIATIRVAALPAGIERVVLAHTVVAAGATPPAIEPAFAAWKDPAATLRTVFDDTRRAALARCDARPRTVRFVVDLRAKATRVWLPAWQFHAEDGSGTTPPAERRVKACLTRAIQGLKPPPLPRAMAELEITVPVAP